MIRLPNDGADLAIREALDRIAEFRGRYKLLDERSVYLIEAIGTERVKIGFSASPFAEARIRGLSQVCPVPIHTLAILRGDMKLEQDIHRSFDEFRVHYEWFEAAPIRKLVGQIPSWIVRTEFQRQADKRWDLYIQERMNGVHNSGLQKIRQSQNS